MVYLDRHEDKISLKLHVAFDAIKLQKYLDYVRQVAIFLTMRVKLPILIAIDRREEQARAFHFQVFNNNNKTCTFGRPCGMSEEEVGCLFFPVTINVAQSS